MNLSTIDHPHQQTLQQAGAGQVQSLLVFHLDERAYGVSIEFVVQIIPMLKLTPVPQVEQVIEGVANIHGKVVPVINVRRHLDLPPIPPRLYTPIILLQTGERMMGLIVDEVADVIHVTANQVTTSRTILPEGCENAPVLAGVVFQDDKAIIVLDPRYLLHPNQMRAVSKAIELMARQLAARKSQGAQTAQTPPVILEAEPQPGENGDTPETDLFEPPCPDADKIPSDAHTPGADSGEALQIAQAQPERVVEPANGSGNGVEPKTEKRKPRRKSRKLEATLADEVASLAVDLPPSEGELKASSENTPVSPDSEKPSGE
jgi:purine-binding chemotaxis protein CheW